MFYVNKMHISRVLLGLQRRFLRWSLFENIILEHDGLSIE